MKKCSYCGKEYPDVITICPIDGEPMLGIVSDRKKVTGVWRGNYSYGLQGKLAASQPVGFTLKLKQGWLHKFTGSVTEDAPQGMPGKGVVEGFLELPKIEFTKQMPVGYVLRLDGTRLTLREYFLAAGHRCEQELPSSPIFYQGTFLDANRVQGTWIIRPIRIKLPSSLSFSNSQSSGFWCAEYITDNVKNDPTNGPTEPLFDKTLLSPQELEQVEGEKFASLGKFNVMDAEKFLDRFGQEAIRFELKRDDVAMREMMPINAVLGGYGGMAQMIEIFIHPDDEEKAIEIIGRDNKV